MNTFTALFGIFRQKGLVTTLQANESPFRFIVWSIVISVLSGLLYGLAMGIGLGLETALKDASKLGLIMLLSVLLAVPIFWIAYRLLGREESLAQVIVVPVTLVTTVAIILAVTAPIVFMLSILSGYSANAVYTHVVIVDLALLVGLYLAGTLLYHGFTGHRRLIIPNLIGFLLMGVILVVLLNFLSPFLEPSHTYSVGTDRLQDGLGIGVAAKVERALQAAQMADQLTYRLRVQNDNGDLVRDYTIHRVGDDFLIEIHRHALAGQPSYTERRIWRLDGVYYTDFDSGRVTRTSADELVSLLEGVLPAAAFRLPDTFEAASWRALSQDNIYTATAVNAAAQEATLRLDATTFRLLSLAVSSAERGLHGQYRLDEIEASVLDSSALESSLHQAIVLGNVDRSDASWQEYVQDETFFVVRFPRTWQTGLWSPDQQTILLAANCQPITDCPSVRVSVYALDETRGPRQYAEALAYSLELQPEQRVLSVSTTTINGQVVGVVEYLTDRVSNGVLVTTHHVETIFVGEQSRYHLDAAALETEMAVWQPLFAELLVQFTYLRPLE